jgi:hypothetical protein
LRLLDEKRQPLSENFYWLPDAAGQYSGLQHMAAAGLKVEAKRTGAGKIAVTLTNAAGNPVAFFNRIALFDPSTRKRILPVFYSDNYISVVPGSNKTVTLDYTPSSKSPAPVVSVKGWNVGEMSVPVQQ